MIVCLGVMAVVITGFGTSGGFWVARVILLFRIVMTRVVRTGVKGWMHGRRGILQGLGVFRK